MQQDDLDKKATGLFAGKVVRKDLPHQIKGGENVPSYVLEYLLGKYRASDNDEEIRIGVDAVKETLTTNYFRHDEANKAQSMVERKGRHRFIDRVEVRFLFSYLQSVKDKLGLTQMLAQKDIHAEAVDLAGGRIGCPCGVAFFTAIISAVRNRHVQAGTVILGDLTIQGNIKGPASITEPLQLALESGAVRALVPVSNKTQFAGLPENVIERLDVVFYGGVDRAVLKTLAM